MLKTYDSIPLSAPSTPLLDGIDNPAQLRLLAADQLQQLADELRSYLLYTVGQTGGHLGAGLGVIELTVALHYVFDTPNDRLIWDVGHQSYPHKILTGRRHQFSSLRQRDGLAGFPKRSESIYDHFGVGHSSTSISAALGMALSARAQNIDRKHIAVIGDGAMTAGMAFEALNHTASSNADMLVILNDNQMSISENVGALSTYFSRIWASRFYNQIREGGKKVLERMPPASEFIRRTEEHMKGLVSPGTLFEEMGFNYIGPIDGHNESLLIETLTNLKHLKEPVLLHCVTEKGRGFSLAEQDPIGYHALGKIESGVTAKPTAVKIPKYQDVFGQWLCDMAAQDQRLMGITPAMREGSGMVEFSRLFPERYFDVAIAEQHAVTLAAGMACEQSKPVVAIYSTFLQRAYDQLIHDVAIQNLDVLFALDRSGVVGEDGPTHAGCFDISYLRCVPNMLVMTPSDENETRKMLTTGFHFAGPASVRYPRGAGIGCQIEMTLEPLPIGKGLVKRQTLNNPEKLALLVFGTPLRAAQQIAEQDDYTLVDMRFVKPLDTELIDQLSQSHNRLVTIEENVIAGGAGSAVAEYLSSIDCNTQVTHLGLPDYFIDHGGRNQLLAEAGLDVNGIRSSLHKLLSNNSKFDSSKNENVCSKNENASQVDPETIEFKQHA